MSIVSVHPAEAESVPVGSALKGLAKVHGLPPFTHLYQSNRTAIVAVEKIHADDWRRALGAGPFEAHAGINSVTHRTEVFFFGSKVRLVWTEAGI